MRLRGYSYLITALFVITGCGGGDEGELAQPQANPIQGSFSVSYRSGSATETGTMFVASSGEAIYHEHRVGIGYGTWANTMDGNNVSITMLKRVVDSLGNEFPSAFDTLPPRSIAFAGSATSSTAWTLSKLTPTSSGSIQGAWTYSNYFAFDAGTGRVPSQFQYTSDWSITATGSISGTDSHDCIFSGQFLPAVEGIFPVSITASNCGATMFYIDNYHYEGFMRLTNNGAQDVLEIIAVNRPAGRAIHFQLFRD